MSGDGGTLGVENRLVKLAMRMVGSEVKLPDPFPVAQQLSELGLSSLKMVNLMLAIETEFDVTIPASDITPENFHSIHTMAALLRRIRP